MAARRTTAKPAEKPADTAGTDAPKAANTKKEPDPAELYGQVVSRTDAGRSYVTSNRFNVANVENRGRELLALSPINYVGPAPILVPMAELDELISDLTALREHPAELVDEA